MGYLQLNRLLAMKRERRRRRQALAPDESVASLEKRKGSSYQQDGNPQSSKRMRYSVPDLPVEIWQHIHSLMPMRDAARAACLSSAFLHSWRSRPKLNLSVETVGFGESRTDFIGRIDRVMKKHSGIGVKALTIQFNGFFRAKDCSYLESWLQIAVTPRIEELIITMFSPRGKSYYNFPCSLLSDESGSSIQHHHLCCCYFRPPAEFGCFQSLRTLHLKHVKITGDGLGSLLSTSFALERLELEYCNQIKHIKIPSVLQWLSHVEVSECLMLQVIENKAPNFHSLDISGQGYCPIQLSFGESSLVKNLRWTIPMLSVMLLRSFHPFFQTLKLLP